MKPTMPPRGPEGSHPLAHPADNPAEIARMAAAIRADAL
jgi:hypothetical protein